VATFNAELLREGPGLLLRDILSGEDPQVQAAAQVIGHVAPDVLVLTGFDFDLNGHALDAFAQVIAGYGSDYAYRFATLPNSGLQTGRDLDGDGRIGRPRDAQGYGEFAGQGGLAILSRHPLDLSGVRDFTAMLWADLPGALITDAEATDIQRLSTVAHWDVPVTLPDGSAFHILAWHASPPVFDGPEDRNGRRNHDETAFWLRYLAGELRWPAPTGPFVIAGDANLDARDGDGLREAILTLLDHPRLSDPSPRSKGGVDAALRDGGANTAHRGDPALDTADWPDDGTRPGNLRVDYVLPSVDWTVVDSGVFWPAPGEPMAEVATVASRHRLVWVDLRWWP
jgi:hypothetical protein